MGPYLFREALAKNLKDEGPSSLKPLDASKLLALVSMLVSEKKWIKENPYDALPFRVTRFTGKGSGLSNHPSASGGLRSIFVNMSKSQCDEADDEKKVSKNIVGISDKPLKRSRSEVLEDCQKLIKKITEENPGGYNMGNFRKDFLETFKYRLDYQNLGYPKLQSLIQIMPEARIESGFIVPSSTPVPYQSDSSFGELGLEPSVSEHENSDTEEAEGASLTLKQNGGERKKKKDSESDLLKILDSRDNDEEYVEKSYAFGEDKLVDGILKSLRKNPSGESRIPG